MVDHHTFGPIAAAWAEQALGHLAALTGEIPPGARESVLWMLSYAHAEGQKYVMTHALHWGEDLLAVHKTWHNTMRRLTEGLEPGGEK